jgi:hypothetical protein
MTGDLLDVVAQIRDLLGRTDLSLKSAVASLTGVWPRLEVASQALLTPPHPRWVTPPLRDGVPLLFRCTSYRVDAMPLSRNIAFVDLERLDTRIASELASGRMGLADVFEHTGATKNSLRLGADGDAPEVDAALEGAFGEWRGIRPYLWRSYVAMMGGHSLALVIEALPVRSWQALVGQHADSSIPGRPA